MSCDFWPKSVLHILLEPSVLENTLKIWSKYMPSLENEIGPSVSYNLKNVVNPIGHVCCVGLTPCSECFRE